MLVRTVTRGLSLQRNSYWLGSAALLAGTVAYPMHAAVQVAAGAVMLYNLCDRADYVNVNLLMDYQKRQELLLTSLKAALLRSSHFAGCENGKLSIGLPKIKFADQGLLGELFRNLVVNKGKALSKFYLDVNYVVIGGGQGYLNCEGQFVKKTEFRFTKITGREVSPGRGKFEVKVAGEWEKGE